MRKPFLDSKPVLIFNGAYTLVGVYRSLHSAADFSGINLQAISFACIGKYVAVGGYYFHHWDREKAPSLSVSDIDVLKLQDYDKMCGVERRYFSTREMAHKRTARNEALIRAKKIMKARFKENEEE